jgi:hypothetical protein
VFHLFLADNVGYEVGEAGSGRPATYNSDGRNRGSPARRLNVSITGVRKPVPEWAIAPVRRKSRNRDSEKHYTLDWHGVA